MVVVGVAVVLMVPPLVSAAHRAGAHSVNAPPAPPQLNTTSFARCLVGSQAKFDLAAEVKDHDLEAWDLLLVWLSVYAGERFPGVNATFQQPAYERWSVPFWAEEKAFAMAMVAAANKAASQTMTPGETYAMALEACSPGTTSPKDAFCAALISHNVFRLLGRYMKNVDKDGVDFSPDWFVANKTVWISTYIPAIHDALIVLRRDKVTEKWGTWYHLHGLVAYGLQEMAVLGVEAGTKWEDIVVALDTLLNPILAGGPEDPVKAREDRESVEIAAQLVALVSDPTPLPPYSPAACASKIGYVLAPWDPTM
ncbi:uncharacterized protein AMSG_04871 [Thecamonas trahens ATCC 50062]|uniref:Alginate lyase domain-containing protein n=1 Tax=Thecamonas trahens ATCC 50062 TaxID=461836 RepID=A0A0L0DAU8_THETB|nr:hypothetical protein AMSG_04871 [Thecamonas trahens ATCC 50062]KNC48423.1 hypothetical protein AMSG_04871 [Thecamonas trahens ATCC 50062]|eukprot:XP_013758540.1 hypothetical protein AMSG_04871 [Thecamonas trahens ATCC 50062]